MTRTAVVLRHEPQVHLGNLEPVLRDYGFDVDYVESPAADLDALNATAADLLVVLGGDMGVYETEKHPSLVHEVTLLQRRLAAERPVVGICLGAQLLASALGAAVFRGPTIEVGFRAVTPTAAGADGPLRHIVGVPVMQWHGDTFELPAGVTRLASSPAYANEAFGIDNWALAVQFHPELTATMHEEWLNLALAEGDALEPAVLRAERERFSAAMQIASRALFSEWLDGLGFQRKP
ncbi:glutamine amidotransferase-related protein [Glaciibacter psychrotolerans]|uniref:GMP synthase (Glutamine-hydrolyzing) n=1 Tax=Glaciibacter psychrotolerans TaxID=670054 RepID=A0A7Z0EFV7_9MICO|nr:gamma-glutamyl-gamma-aminobutyrate hydrolase family protein [Leifsonia psychrotolerans]NYJ20758.1 GMP synthase (glutamine-hydrolyzing) [Leifsonia psychrotolerans]